MPNQEITKVSTADDATIKAAILVIETTLIPYLIALTDSQRKGGVKMGDKSIAFVDKGGVYGNQFSDEMPASIKVVDLANNVAVVNVLSAYAKPLATILRGVEDTMLSAGTVAMEESLNVYSAIKQAAHNGVPGAQVAYNDMKERFTKTTKKKVVAVVTPPTTTTP